MTVQSWRRVPLFFLSIKTVDTTFKIKSRFDSRTGKEFSSHLQNVQISSGAHPTSHSLTTMGSFLGGKVAGAWSCLVPSMSFHGYKWQPICHQFLTCLKSSTMTTSSRTERQIFTRRREWRNSCNVVHISDKWVMYMVLGRWINQYQRRSLTSAHS